MRRDVDKNKRLARDGAELARRTNGWRVEDSLRHQNKESLQRDTMCNFRF